MPFDKVPFGEIDAFNVVVEVPTGGQKKYEYDAEINAIKLDKVLYGQEKFPLNYGHVAETFAQDQSLLDVFVFSTYPITTGTVVTCRAIGVLKVIDEGKKDDKILAVPIAETALEHLQDIADIPKDQLFAIEEFYKFLPKSWNKQIEYKEILGKAEAIKELQAAREFKD